MTNVEQNKSLESAKWFFDNITKWLKDLMTQITGWINSLLVSLWLKKEEEINKETKKNNLDLKNFLETIEDKSKSKEKLENSKEYFENLKFIKKSFGDEIYEKEIGNILSLFKYGEFTDKWVLDRLNEEKDLEITENQSNFVLWILDGDMKYIKENKDNPSILQIIKEIKWEENIHDIVKAHKKLKIEDAKAINKEKIKNKIKENKDAKDPRWNDLAMWWDDDVEEDDEN